MTRPVFTSSVLPPRERGAELGARFAAEITDTVARYRRLFERRAEGEFDVDLWSERAWRAIRHHAPVHAEEIAGIADGAGLRVEQVASVNARTEILVAANPTGQTECSTVVSTPAGRPPVAVQTWDWYDAMTDGWFTWTIPHEDGRVVQTVTEFGMLAKIGVNDRGVGVMLNMLHHKNDADAAARGEIGHPVHLLSRAILDDAGSTRDAVRIASAPPTSASTSLTVVDTTGEAVSIELFPGGPGLLEPTDGVLVRTNHFVSDGGHDGCLASTIGVSTELRREHLLGSFAATPPSTATEVVDAMTHHDEDGGVCRHGFTDPDPLLWHRTLATVAIDVVTRTLDVRDGGPCGRRELPEAQAAFA
ncbi:MAG: peptidase C45 [Nocardioidaceae bacterium]|nr:peptidase C45 [Nocardioidaceae bacterium]